MSIKQVSVFLENKAGQLNEIVAFLAGKNINLRALSIADTDEYGILRMITENPEATKEALCSEGYSATLTNVLAVAIEDKPGGLSKIIALLSEADISVEYTYAFISHKPDYAYMVFRVNDREKAEHLLESANITVATLEELFN